ncbi:MAG: sugar ABC transporter permease, partial [Myxococcota bacterium]|nr:sugar ABC transporter permease [Myxococcota bacterium]
MAALGEIHGADAPARLRFEAVGGEGAQRPLLAAYATIRPPGASAVGMVRVAAWQAPTPDPIPWWRVWLGVFLAALVGLGARRLEARWAAAGAAIGIALLTVAIAWGRDGVFALVSGVAVLPLAWLTVRPLSDLLRGVREQPGTYLYVLPAVVATIVLVFIPFGMGIVLAFFDADGAPVGLANFREILVTSETADTNFWWTLWMTVVWTVTNIVLHVSIGLGLAMVLNRPRLEWRWLYRVLLIVPWAVPNYITALIWKGMFNEHEGAVNAAFAIFGLEAIDWFGTGVLTNFTANLVTNVWLGFPFMMVVCLGALQAIPREIYEAATIDGAGRLQAFRHVTLPLLKPALVPAIIVGTIWTFNMFNVIYLVSGGGPDGQTDILITEAYHAFKVLKRYGLAAAYSLLIFVILVAYGAMTNRIT